MISGHTFKFNSIFKDDESFIFQLSTMGSSIDLNNYIINVGNMNNPKTYLIKMDFNGNILDHKEIYDGYYQGYSFSFSTNKKIFCVQMTIKIFDK